MTNEKEHKDSEIAAILSKALPYVQRYDGAVVVIKFGGNAMMDARSAHAFARDVVLMRQVGVNPIIVHGGGPMITNMLARVGIESEFINGKRITDTQTMEIVEMVLSGLINKQIVQAITQEGGCAVGLSGKDGKILPSVVTAPSLGLVGTPAEVDTTIINLLTAGGVIPVISPIGFNENGETLNVNGDIAAGAIASALKADRLLILTDIAGVMDSDGKLVPEINSLEIERLIENKTIARGMIPKTQTAIEALKNGVRGVVILDGRTPNACLRELFTDSGAGTLIKG